MKITLAVNGRFHTFDVAHQLEQRGALRALITAYPYLVARRWKLSRRKVRALPIIELTKRAGIRVGVPAEWFSAPFDLAASRLLPADSDIVETWSSSSLFTLRRAKRLGAVTVLKRSSAHVLTQSELLQEEAERWGGVPNPVSDYVIEREMREYEETDYILTSSSFIARTFRERGLPPEKILCLPLAVDTEQFAAVPRTHEPFRVIFCGSAGIRKGVQYLLQAFAELKLPRAELWFVGGIQPEARALLRRFDGDWIRVMGSVPHHELPRMYGQCDVLCLPSIEEGFGNVVAQAMSCGLPAIVTENVGAADLLDESTGYVLPIRDVDALKRTLLSLYQDRARCRAMGAAAAAKLRSGWSWADYTERLLALYASLLARQTGASRAANQR